MTPQGTARRGRGAVVAVVTIGALALGAAAYALLAVGGPTGPTPLPPSAAGEPTLDDLGRLGRDADGRSAQARTTPAFGMSAWRGNALGPAEFARLRSSGSRYYRFNLVTSTSDDREPAPPIQKYDRLLRAGVSQQIDFLPVLLRSRTQLTGRKPGQVAEPPETPRERATWAARVRYYVERYGPDGQFWRENPDLPYRPLRAWEVWNEPNLRQFWDRRKVDPRAYGRLLRETRDIIRAADPRARIVSAGLSSNYKGPRFLSAMLAEAGSCSVDAIGIHPYAPTTAEVVAHLTDARRVADARGATGVPLWTTEIGWKVGPRSYTALPTEAAQARAYRDFLAASDRLGGELKLGPSFAFVLRDRANLKTGRVDSTFGLRRIDDSPRPSWGVWSQAALAAPELPMPRLRRCAS